MTKLSIALLIAQCGFQFDTVKTSRSIDGKDLEYKKSFLENGISEESDGNEAKVYDLFTTIMAEWNHYSQFRDKWRISLKKYEV